MSDHRTDPDVRDAPLTVEEIDEILQERPRWFLKDPDVVWQFVSRARATAAAARRAQHEYERELHERSYLTPHSGIPGNLSPEQAVRYLSRQQLRRLFDTYAQQQLDALDRKERAAVEAEAQYRSVLADLEHAAGEIATDPRVPQDVRDMVVRLCNQVRNQPHEETM